MIPSADAAFVCAMEEVLDVYSRPYGPERPVVCFDESPKQLIGEVRRPYIGEDGAKYEDCEYRRNGTADLLMVVEPLGGRREVLVRDRHDAATWARTMETIVEKMYPRARKVTLVMDNLSSHKTYNLYRAFPPEKAKRIKDRMEIVYTPKHGSWLNIAECELSVVSRQALKKRIPTKKELEAQVRTWSENRNNAQKGVDWQFTTEDARTKLKRLYPTVLT